MTDTASKKKLGRSKQGIPSDFDADYLRWKDWGRASFGTLSPAQARYFSATLKKTQLTFPHGTAVLEIGFGNGTFLRYGKNKGWEVSGVEINPDLVEIAKRQDFNVQHLDNLASLPSKHFDLVVAFDVLEHIPQNDLLEFLIQINRILKPGGCFLARFPNGDSPLGLASQHGDMTHVTTIGSGKAQYLCNKLGVHPVYIGAEAQPIWGVGTLYFAHRLFAVPIKKGINLLVNLVFYPKNPIAFCSPNLVMIYKTPKNPSPTNLII